MGQNLVHDHVCVGLKSRLALGFLYGERKAVSPCAEVDFVVGAPWLHQLDLRNLRVPANDSRRS